MPVMEKLLEEWKTSGFEFVTLRQLYDSLDLSALPKQEITWAEVDGLPLVDPDAEHLAGDG